MGRYTQSFSLALLCCLVVAVSAQWMQTGHDSQHTKHVELGYANRTDTPLWVSPYVLSSNDKHSSMYLPNADSGIVPEAVVDAKGVFYYISGGNKIVSKSPDGNMTWTTITATNVSKLTSNLAILASAPVTLVATVQDKTGHGHLISFVPNSGNVIPIQSAALECKVGDATFPVQFVGNPVVHPSNNILVTTRCHNETALFSFAPVDLSALWNVTLGTSKFYPSLVAAASPTGPIYVTDSAVSVRSLTSLGQPGYTTTLPVKSLSIHSLTNKNELVIEWHDKNGVGTTILDAAGKISSNYSQIKPIAQGEGPVFFGWYKMASKKPDYRVVAINTTRAANSSRFLWVSNSTLSSGAVRASVDSGLLVYLYHAEADKQEIHALSAQTGKEQKNWPRTLFTGSKKHNRAISFTPVLYADSLHNATRVLVPFTINKNSTDLNFEVLTCCSKYGTCTPDGCVCQPDYYNDFCDKHCVAADDCHGNGKCNATGFCDCHTTHFWELKTYAGDDCSEIVNLTIFGGIAVAILFLLILSFSAWVIWRTRKPAPLPVVNDYGSLSTVSDPYN
eukprot:TRINITY_DN590_c0_g1_i1.p1 TRINITY_DN590_c0_g1~~TRINITY_DN590_c0_g1_i1.p1  ORF type:complete len:562 (-),score=76.09 TRINITY_DN590_c0_g1_i1:52-1737(-)